MTKTLDRSSTANLESLASLAQDAPVGLLQVDKTMTIRSANAQAQDLLSGGLERLIGRQLGDIFFHDNDVFPLFDKALNGSGEIGASGLTISGPMIEPVRVNARLNFDGTTRLFNVVLARPAKGSQQDPSGLATFARMLGHEIKNPLGGISGAAQLMERSCQPEQAELLALIRNEAHRISRLIDRFSAFELYHAPRFSPLNIHEVLEDVLTMQMASSPNVVFKKSFDPSLPEIHADRDHIHEAILNLIKNAAEATGSSDTPEVKVSTSYQTGIRLPRPGNERRLTSALRIRIRDNGAGISHAIQDQVFKPFFSTKSSGSGIGLSVCQDIAHAHGGRLSFTSHPGRTQFDLMLPLTREGG